jgi:diguanylate cyclase (GGDEF)-like protein
MPSLGQKAVTASIGVASFPIHGVSVEAIIREADNALYRCKQYGRNRVALAALAEVEETAPTGSEII